MKEKRQNILEKTNIVESQVQDEGYLAKVW